MICYCCGREPEDTSLLCRTCASTIHLYCGMKFCGTHQIYAMEEHMRTCESCKEGVNIG